MSQNPETPAPDEGPPSARMVIADPPHLAPRFGNLPGTGRLAVLVMWLRIAIAGYMVALGIAAAIAQYVYDRQGFEGRTSQPGEILGMEPWTFALWLAIAGWTVLQIVLAVKLTRRKRWARYTVLTLEIIGLAAALAVELAQEMDLAPVNAGTGWLGVILGAAIIAALRSQTMAAWCDR
ncbi:hypothetical protein [Glycomyces buryatensis]|uniref:Uncharacterized protein n=1 Tax=Glycomyces buryatensis TaxID=2570927 RepID=A0A4S8QAC4_9ACTN|nr:hypothetical protein [Glycomyces buryatensis]THV41433.1 hypothetical protein FAB82_11585 [Glycomyces buryatensis]